MTYVQICEQLMRAGIESASDDAAMLIRHFCGVDRAQLVLCRDRDFDDAALIRAVKRRAERYPLQYILGTWGFYDSEFKVSEGVLIPRADTELIVERAVQALPRGAVFADVGCGSGCIVSSVLRAREDVRAFAVDISPTALDVTQKNAAALGVLDRLTLVCGDMRDAKLWEGIRPLDAIISNPPYIPTEDVKMLAPELAFEPVLALDGGADGLDFYRALIKPGASALADDGFMLFECGVGQTRDICAIAESCGYKSEVYFDIENRDRAVKIYNIHPEGARYEA